jgi:hypothetical protein
LKIYIDPFQPATRAVIKSPEIRLREGLLPFFYKDNFNFEVELLETPTWKNYQNLSLDLTIGTFEQGQLLSPVQGTLVNGNWVFNLDLDQPEIATFLVGSLSRSTQLEIQITATDFSRTLVQQSLKLYNRIGESIEIELDAPNTPLVVDSELIIAPSPPIELSAISTPQNPRNVQLGKFSFAPTNVRAGNFSVPPFGEPSLVESSIVPQKPRQVFWVNRRLRDAPNEPDLVSSEEKFFPPQPVEYVFAVRVVDPVSVESVTSFEVTNYKQKNQAHRFLQLDLEEFSLPNGQLQNDKEIPFVYNGTGVSKSYGFQRDPNGFPIYTRNTTNAFNSPNLDNPTNTESISFEIVGNFLSIDGFYPLTTDEDIALEFSEFGQTSSHTFNGVQYFMPTWATEGKTFKGNHDGNLSDSLILRCNLHFAYDYANPSLDANGNQISGVDFSFFTNKSFVNYNQIGRLGLKDYGGEFVSYYDNQIKLLPFVSDRVIQKPQIAPSLVEAEEMVLPSATPSNIDAVIFEWDVARYSPSLWIDASQESEEFVNLTNHAGTSHEVTPQGNPTYFADLTQNGLPLYDFSTGLTCYNISGNVFGRSITPEGGEIEMFVVFQPLTYQNSHLFVNAGGTSQRFTCHAPHTGGQFIFDAGSSNPARVQSSVNLQIENFYLLSFVASNLLNELKLYVNGLETASKGYDLKLNTEYIRFGGWNNAPYSQKMYLAEMVFFKNKLELDKRQKVEGYLAHKWGLTNILDASHPYKYKHPTNIDEVVPLDPFVLPPLEVSANTPPIAPQTPVAGLLGYPPSDVEAVSYPNTPSLIDAEEIPYIVFDYSGQTLVSKIFNINQPYDRYFWRYGDYLGTNISGDVDQVDIQTFADDIVANLSCLDGNGSPLDVTWSIQSVDSRINASVSNIVGSQIDEFTLSANQDFYHKDTFKIKLLATDSQGNSNVFEIVLNNDSTTGTYNKTFTWITPTNFDANHQESSLGIGNETYNVYDIKTNAPDEIDTKLGYRKTLRWRTELETGFNYQFKVSSRNFNFGLNPRIELMLPRGFFRDHEWRGDYRHCPLNNWISFDTIGQVYEPTTSRVEYANGYFYKQTDYDPMYKIELVGINEIVAGGHYEFEFELTLYNGSFNIKKLSQYYDVTNFSSSVISNNLWSREQQGSFNWWESNYVWANGADLDRDDAGFAGDLNKFNLNPIGSDWAFQLKCRSGASTTNFLCFSTLKEPSQIELGDIKPQIPPSNLTASTISATFPSEFDYSLTMEKVYLDDVDLTEKFIARGAYTDWKGVVQPARTGEGSEWVWGFNIGHNFHKQRQLFANISEFQNYEILEEGLVNYGGVTTHPSELIEFYLPTWDNNFDVEKFKAVMAPYSINISTGAYNYIKLTLNAWQFAQDKKIKLSDGTILTTSQGGLIQTTEGIKVEVFKVVNGLWQEANKRGEFYLSFEELGKTNSIVEKNANGQNIIKRLPQLMLPFLGKGSQTLMRGKPYTFDAPEYIDNYIAQNSLRDSYQNNDTHTRGFLTQYHAGLFAKHGGVGSLQQYKYTHVPDSLVNPTENWTIALKEFGGYKNPHPNAHIYSPIDRVIEYIESNSSMKVERIVRNSIGNHFTLRDSRISFDARYSQVSGYNFQIALNHWQCVEPAFDNIQNDLGDDIGLRVTTIAKGNPLPDFHPKWGVNRVKYFGGANVSSFPPVPPNWVQVGGEGELIPAKDLPNTQVVPARPFYHVTSKWNISFQDLVIVDQKSNYSDPWDKYRSDPEQSWVGKYILTNAKTSTMNTANYISAGAICKILSIQTFDPTTTTAEQPWSQYNLLVVGRNQEGRTGQIVIKGNQVPFSNSYSGGENNFETIGFDGTIYDTNFS